METIIEFGAAYSAVTGEYVGEYVPAVTYSPDTDSVTVSSHVWWNFLHGHRYNGASSPIFEPAETASDEQIRGWVREAGGDVFAMVVVDVDHDDTSCDGSCNGDECDTYENERSIGWAVIYRNAGAVSA